MTAEVDAHVHVWDPRALDYPWLRALPALDRPFLPGEADAPAVRAVFVQAAAASALSLDEARWAAGLDWPQRAAIVAAADLRSPDLVAHLDALAAVPHVAGVRHLLQDEDADGFPSVLPGLRILAARGLAFDACVRHAQLPALRALLAAVPELRVVVDHLGKPPVDAGIDSAEGRAWADSIDALAALPRVFVKLSGLAAEASDAASLDRNADAFLAHALAAFGPGRSMVGSDWPVSARLGAAVSPASWTSRVLDVVGADAAAREAVSGGTAASFYGL